MVDLFDIAAGSAMTEPTSKSCLHCGLLFQKRNRASTVEWAQRKYCSHACSNRAKGERQKKHLRARFFSYVTIPSPYECWPWHGYQDSNGYGRISVGGRSGRPELAHRVSYLLHNGYVPKDLSIRHKCDNPQCVNPAHLEPGTHAKNMQDFAKRGHGNRGAANGQSVLTEDQVKNIKRRLQNGERPSHIARDFPVTRSAIDLIKNRGGWREVCA